jgi:hypothetical protein
MENHTNELCSLLDIIAEVIQDDSTDDYEKVNQIEDLLVNNETWKKIKK